MREIARAFVAAKMRLRSPAFVLVLPTFLMMLALPGAAFASPRTWQPLILKGAQIAPLLGRSEGQLEVLAVHGGRLEPIPFQVDEVLPDGRYALPNGPEPTKDPSPGILHARDEVVMMISDLGPRAAPGIGLPEAALEIEVKDPLGGGDRYAYVAAEPRPRRSSVRYVQYDAPDERIEADHYRIGLTHGVPTDYRPQSHRGEGGPGILDKFKTRARAKIFGIFRFRLNENDVQNRLLAWRAGPVRVIRRVKHSLRLLFNIRSPEVESHNFFYRDYVENPFKVRLPWIPRLFFRDSRARLDFDFIDLGGYAFSWSGMKVPPLQIGDLKGEHALEAEDPPVDWIAVSGHGRVLVQTLAPSPDLQKLDRRLYFHDDPEKPDPPENVRGEHPGIGYLITGWERLGSGVHKLDLLLLGATGDYDPAMLVEELKTPPAVEVHPALSGQGGLANRP